MKKAQSNIASTFDSWSSIKGCYRFFSNDKVESKIILEAHIDSTLSRILEKTKQVFVIHDTTYINYKNRKKTSDLDRIIRNLQYRNIVKGVILHNSFTVNNLATRLDLVGQIYAKSKKIIDASRKVKKGLIHNKSVEEKESYRWIDAIKPFQQVINSKQKKVVHISDRESDFYQLYKECYALEAKFLIRASHNRAINKIKRQELCKNRIKAKLSMAFKKFTLSLPPNSTTNKDEKQLYNIDLYGVIILEKSPPKNHEPLEWLLITNIPGTSIEEAEEKMHWCNLRWNVKTFHKILKSGCSVEDAQLRSKKKLIKDIIAKSVIAPRIFWLSRISRVCGEYNYNTILTQIEQRVLFKRSNKDQNNIDSINVKQALNWIDRLGGYISRNSNSPRGIITIRQG